MLITGSLLALLAVVLAWPVPVLLAHRTSAIDPASHLVLWQAVGLAGGLSLIGSAVVFATAPIAGSLHDGLLRLTDLRTLAVLQWWQWAFLIAAGLLGIRLVGSLIAQSIAVHRHRRKHAELIHLLTEASDELPDTRVLETASPVAYCLPGRRSGTTVVSTGLLRVLSVEQRRAVVAHEQSHLAYHHDLLVLPFAAWNRALPFLPATRTALGAVSALIEFMADDRARRVIGPEPLATAIGTHARLHHGDHSAALTRARQARLACPLPPALRRVRVLYSTAAAALLLLPTLMLVLPTLLSQAI